MGGVDIPTNGAYQSNSEYSNGPSWSVRTSKASQCAVSRTGHHIRGTAKIDVIGLLALELASIVLESLMTEVVATVCVAVALRSFFVSFSLLPSFCPDNIVTSLSEFKVPALGVLLLPT